MLQTDIRAVDNNKEERMNLKPHEPLKIDIVWGIVLFFVLGHLSAIYGLYLVFASAQIYTTLFGKCSYILFKFVKYSNNSTNY